MPQGGFRSRLVGIAIALGYGSISMQLMRSSPATIGPDLMRDLDFAADGLGVLTGSYFYAVALCQIPVGILLDRIGTRRTMTGAAIISMIGAFIFATAGSLFWLTVGRLFLAVGSSPVVIGGFLVLGRWLAPDRVTRASALHVSVGLMGSVLATAPFAYAASVIGWRGNFYVASAMFAGSAALYWFAMRDAPPGARVAGPAEGETLAQSLLGVLRIVIDRKFYTVACLTFFGFPVIATVLVLISGPYLRDLHGFDQVARGNALLAMGILIAVTPAICSQFTRWFSVRTVATTMALIAIVVLAILALIPGLPLAAVAVLFATLGGLGAYAVLLITSGRTMFGEDLAARTITALNLVQMTGMGTIQLAVGSIIAAFPPVDGLYPESAYRAAFGFLAVGLGLATLYYVVGGRPPAKTPA